MRALALCDKAVRVAVAAVCALEIVLVCACAHAACGVVASSSHTRAAPCTHAPHTPHIRTTTKVAVVEGGAAYSWGYGGFGALGLGDKLDRALPQLINVKEGEGGGDGARTRIVLVASGEAHSLAVADDGALFSWGEWMG